MTRVLCEQRLDTGRIAFLNDEFRRRGYGGEVVMTSSMRNRGDVFTTTALAKVQAFEAFNPDNDPGDMTFGSSMSTAHTCAGKLATSMTNKSSGLPTRWTRHAPNG